ncbi:hypothetical protein [Rivularia sp. UHCC 0363]|uniref:hypothetical protein n=1 Tax=Rivularia sp. UHCC 0363 TaxID=3110244 RepID=UPI002B21398F|nr:hypothetical protein [Rivularia sp. UHCC 0363]MEA5596980.1 hypothetical protein [Rivularia sp. UHCC 0363]
MSKNIKIQDVVFVVASDKLSPSVVNAEFLQLSGIIPQDFKLARQPVYTQQNAQLTFTDSSDNVISIVAETNRIIFMEAVGDRDISSLQIASIASKFVKALPNIEIEAVGINPRGYKEDPTGKYMESLLSPNAAWLSVGVEPMRASLNLVYKYERASMYLNISEAALRKEDETSTPIVMFNGSFSYELEGETKEEKQENLHKAIENWQTDVATYSELVNNKFLAQLPQEATVEVPSELQEESKDVFAMSV